MLSLSLWSSDTCAQKQPQESSQEAAEEPARESVEQPASTPPANLSPPAKPWQAQETVRPAAPDVYLLPDESGKLRKVLGFRYEDFFKAWNRNKRAVTVSPPRFVLDTWNVTGEVSEPHARLRIEFEIIIQAAGWIDIPIQLPEFIVEQLNIEDQATGECLVFDKQRHGHVIWLAGQVGQKRKFVLQGFAKLKLNPGSHEIELHLPRSTSSQFSLLVPDSSSRFESSPELILTTVATELGTTEVKLLGQANPIQLSWTPAQEKASNQGVLVEVEGETNIYVDRRRVIYDATLQINSFGSPLEQLQIRLPPHAQLNLAKTSNAYQITEIDQVTEIGTTSDDDHRRVVEVRPRTSRQKPEAPRQEPWEIHLSAERPLESFSGSAECKVEGFEVLDAFPQSGTVTLQVDDQLQAYFDTHGDIDQTPLLENATKSESRLTLGQFRYSRFPWQLVVHTSSRQRRVSVKPHYDLMIDSDEARLDVEYDYQLTGAKVFSFRVDLQGWKLTDAPLDSGGLIDTDRVVVTHEGRLVLPLVDSNTQQVRLKLSLRKDLQLSDNTFFLPEPLGAFVVEGELLVDSAQALRVVPLFTEMAGLGVISESDASAVKATHVDEAESQDPFLLRTFLPRPKFVAEVTQRQRQVTATQQTQVDLDQQSIRVQQQIDYQAKYRPVSTLSLSFPEQLLSNDSLTITLDDEPLPFRLSTSVDEASSDLGENDPRGSEPSFRQVIVSLPRPMQNDIPIEIAYEMAAPELEPELETNEFTPIHLQLAFPKDLVTRHEAIVIATEPVHVTLNQRSGSDTWKVIPEENIHGNSAGTLKLLSDEKLAILSLYVQVDSSENARRVTLERAWFQTWIATGQRQERAVFRFHTDHPTVFVQLPANFENTGKNMEIEILLDDVPYQYESPTDNRLQIDLPTENPPDNYSLELRYQTDESLPSWGKIRSTLPRLECRLASAPIYWQLILPRSWQVASSPKQLIPDYWLGWKNYRWGRQPNLFQADLEQIAGAKISPAPTPLSTQYVYRSFEIPSEIKVLVIRRAWLLVAGAFFAFGLGLLALYTSFARKNVFWLGLALALLVGVFSYPEVALLVIQAVLVGGLMTFVTGVLKQVFQKSENPPFSLTTYPVEPSAQLTEPWQVQLGESPTPPESTATLPTGGPSS